MYLRDTICICIVLLLLSIGNYSFSQLSDEGVMLTTSDGLSQGLVYDILQDEEGFMWFATKDGLNRYDGYNFKVFTNDPDNPWSISGNSISKLFEDSAGRIWAISDNSGINIYDKRTGRFHQIKHDHQKPTGLSGNYISSIVEDSSGYFVVGVAEKEINMFKLEDDFFELQETPEIIRISMPPQKRAEKDFTTLLKGIAKDAKGRIWVGVQDAMYRLDVKQAKLDLAIEGFSIGTVFTNPDGSFWGCGLNQPLFHWDGKNASIYSKHIKGANDIRVDDKGKMWFSRFDTLYGIDLSLWNPGDVVEPPLDHCFYRWQPKTSLGNSPFRSLTLDRSGLVWTGTNGIGLYKINANRLRFSHHLAGISVRQISVVSENEVYLSDFNFNWYTQDGNLLKMESLGLKEKKQIYDNTLILKSGEYCIRNPSIFNGSKLIKYNKQTNEIKNYPINWHHYDSQPMIEGQDGSIWMAGINDVLTRIDPLSGKLSSYDLLSGEYMEIASNENKLVSREYSTALYEDSDGILWIGTERGFTKCVPPTNPEDPLQIVRYKNIPGDSNSLSYNHVSCFSEDPINPDRYIWICTKGGGINQFDKESGNFNRLTKKDGLPDNVVYGILPDDDGNLWGSTNKGIFCMRPNKHIEGNQGEFIFRNFSKADGLQENEFNTGAYAKMPDGRLAFGGINGYNVFDPKEILSDDYMPPVYITNILINNHPVSVNDESRILENTIETTEEITLSNLDNILTLEFASLDFTAPDRNRYRYQLVGMDDTWVDAGNNRSATFLNLQPNDYTFRVQGTNSQGIWSDKIAQLKIIVLPPWWRTWWAYLIYILFTAFLFWKYYEFITNREKLNQQLIFEKSESEKAKELDHLKTRLYTNLTHEFRTPLTIIIGMVDQIKSSSGKNLNDGLNMIKRNGENLLQLVNKMLDFSKIESGKMVLDERHGNIIQTLKNVTKSFVQYAANKDIEIHFLSDLDEKTMSFDDEKIRHILSNLISNAIKFTRAGGHVYISVRQQEENLIIKIKDTGKGISIEHQEKIFDRFYQVESADNRTSEGSGIGLALCKELVFLMNGKISVQSPVPSSSHGSEFTVSLPMTNISKSSASIIDLQKGTQSKITSSYIEKPLSNRTEKPPSGGGREDEKVILLVEDNADIVAYIASCLEDYKLLVATNGSEGLEMAIESTPDLIVSDVMMPIMDGFEMCEKIKQDSRTNHIPIVMLTAKADIVSKIEGLEFGANAYISKPFDKDELLLTIRNLFNLRKQLQKHYRGEFNNKDFDKTGEVFNVKLASKQDEFVIQVTEKVESRIDDFDLSVEQLAKELHFSQSQFSRKLNALIGMTPVKYIRQLRLDKAKKLLLNPELSITVIAFECGFSDPSYFSRVFKKEFRLSPKEWREESMNTG